MLMRVPANRLDRGDMLRKPVQWRIPHLVPHEQLVVVPAARELVLGHVPLEAADFLSVPRELGDVVRGDPDVAVVDEAVVRARREEVVVPREGADACGVAGHRAD